MALEYSHLREVGVVGYPAVAVRAAPPAAPAAAAAAPAAAAPAAGKKEKSAPAPADGGKKDKGGKASKTLDWRSEIEEARARLRSCDSKMLALEQNLAAPPPVPAGPPPPERSAAELAKMSKEERTQYHLARRAAQSAASGSQDAAAGANATAPAQLTKAQRRALQESQRKVKEDKANANKDGDEMLEELKLQGLTEEQAKEVIAAMNSGDVAEGDDEEDDDEIDTLLGAVRVWMREQPDGDIPSTSVRDFNLKVRFQGHVNTTPPDHLGAMLKICLEQALPNCDLASAKIQPGLVAKAFTQVAKRWTNILRGLYSKVPDVLDAINVVVGTITEGVAASGAPEKGQDSAVVGCLMAIRELEDLVEDEDLLIGCKGVEPRSHVLQKFIEFLEEAVEEDDDEEGSDDE